MNYLLAALSSSKETRSRGAIRAAETRYHEKVQPAVKRIYLAVMDY
jgi:hypothetical protein